MKLFKFNLASVSKLSELGKELLPLDGKYLEAKNLLKWLAFLKNSTSNLFYTNIGGINPFIHNVVKWPNIL